MRVIIVGAGIAGLSLAIALSQSNHNVLLLESAKQLAEIGAGVQLTPQAVRYLIKWGLREDLMRESIVPDRMAIRHYEDGEMIGAVPIALMEQRYGAPYIVIHRANLHSILCEHVIRGGAEIRLDSRVVRYDFGEGAVLLHGGEWLRADMVVAADGINSFARRQLLGDLDPGSQPTGWAAFRLSVDVSRIRDDDLIDDQALGLDSGRSNFWIAPHRSCMTYLVKGATMLNIVLSHRDNVDTRNYSLAQYQEAVAELVRDFEPQVRRLIELASPHMANHPVYQVPPLPRWADDSGRFTLLGDSAHAMAFYMSMGVSLAVEDATALTTALNFIESATRAGRTSDEGLDAREMQGKVIKAFARARMDRVAAVQDASLRGGNSLHVEDGPDRIALYEALRRSQEGMLEPTDELGVNERCFAKDGSRGDERWGPGGISDKRARDWCYEFDTERDIMEAITTHINTV